MVSELNGFVGHPAGVGALLGGETRHLMTSSVRQEVLCVRGKETQECLFSQLTLVSLRMGDGRSVPASAQTGTSWISLSAKTYYSVLQDFRASW